MSFAYTGLRLEDALTDISVTYGVPFSYSPKRIPINHPVTAFVEGVRLQDGLEEVLAEVPVAFREINGQVVLKPDLRKEIRQLSKLELPTTTTPRTKYPAIEIKPKLKTTKNR